MKNYLYILMVTVCFDSSVPEKIGVLNCEKNESSNNTSGATFTGLSFDPIKPFTACARIQFEKLRMKNSFAYIGQPFQRPQLEMQVNAYEIRVAVASQYRMAFLKSRLRPFQWYHICVTFPGDNSTLEVHLDGDIIYKTHLDLHQSIGSNVFVGYRDPGHFKDFPFFGSITQFNIWNEILPQDIINGIANCSINPSGSYVSWDDSNWAYNNVQIYNIELESLCHRYSDEKYTIFGMSPYSEATFICEGIGGRLVSPTSMEEVRTIFIWAQQQKNNFRCSNYWAGFSDEIEEGHWLHHLNRTSATNLPWGTDEPNGDQDENCASLNSFGLSDDLCTLRECFICEKSLAKPWTLYGSCEELPQHQIFFLEFSNLSWKFRSYGNYMIERNPHAGVWSWKDSRENKVIATLSSFKSKFPIGRRKWKIHRPICGHKVQEKTLLLSTCGIGQFSCDDAKCIPYKRRCDYHPDCRDKSDEIGCRLFKVPDDYRVNITPRSVSNSSVYTVTATIDLETLRVETNAMIIHTVFNLSIEWQEGRVKFYNLKRDLSVNIIDATKKELWVPSISFLNAKNQPITVLDTLSQIRVRRKQMSRYKDSSLAEDVKIFPGASNPIIIFRKYHIAFTCDFDLRGYPFDQQTCFMDLRQRSATMKSLQFNSSASTVTYSGNTFLMEYEVGKISLTTYKKDGYSGLKVKIPLRRQKGQAFINIYLPSFTMLITGYLTLFFKQNTFEVKIMAGLTSLLVVVTLFTETTSSLPKTSYFKLVDIWLLFCIFTTFLVLVFHIFLDSKVNRKNTFPERKPQNKWIMAKLFKTNIPQTESFNTLERYGKIAIAGAIVSFNAIYWISVYLF